MYPDETTITIDGKTYAYPGLKAGKFTDGDPSDPSKPASFIPAATVNLLLDSVSSAILALGLDPSNSDPDRLGTGVTALVQALADEVRRALAAEAVEVAARLTQTGTAQNQIIAAGADVKTAIITFGQSGRMRAAVGARNTPEGSGASTSAWNFEIFGDNSNCVARGWRQGDTPADGFVLTRVDGSWCGTGVWMRLGTPAIGTVERVTSADSSPASRYPGTTWTDVSYEEEGCVLRVGTSIIGKSLVPGTPARFTISVASGVPTVALVSGGSNGFYPANTTIPLTVVGICATQWVGSATTNALGVITGVTVTTAGVGYLSGGSATGSAGANVVQSGNDAVIVYDGYSRVADSFERHGHGLSLSTGNTGSYGITGLAGVAGIYARNDFDIAANRAGEPIDLGSGASRTTPETTSPYCPSKKYRRTA